MKKGRYTRDGCVVATSCFDCPLPDCKYSYKDIEAKKVKVENLERYGLIQKLKGEGASTKELAERFGVNARTIRYIMKKQL